jgi:hypothetical protein
MHRPAHVAHQEPTPRHAQLCKLLVHLLSLCGLLRPRGRRHMALQALCLHPAHEMVTCRYHPHRGTHPHGPSKPSNLHTKSLHSHVPLVPQPSTPNPTTLQPKSLHSHFPLDYDHAWIGPSTPNPTPQILAFPRAARP